MTTPNPVVGTLGNLILITIDWLDNSTFMDGTCINSSRSLDYSANTTSEEVVDLANRAASAAMVRHTRSTDRKITGEGMINTADLLQWVTWAKSGAPHAVTLTYPGAYSEVGQMVLTGFTVSAQNMTSATCSITLEQSAPSTVTASS